MVAPATAAASDSRVRAQAHLESTLAFLASAKNTPVRASDLSALATSLVARADEARLHQIVETRSGPVAEALAGSLAESLDWIAARNIVKLFAYVVKLQLGASELQALVASLQLAVKNRQTREGLSVRWPDGPALETAAISHAGTSAPRNAAQLEAVLIDSFRAFELEWFEPAFSGGA